MAPSVDLASHVHEREAAAFTRVLGSESKVSPLTRLCLAEVLSAVQAAARTALGPGARVELAGSLAKGTSTHSSDADLYVHTGGAPATLAQRQALEALLRAHPAASPEHVRLLKLAIHARLYGMDCDVVCADTVEYGARPAVDERVTADATVASAAAALKFWANRVATRGRKLPGHALESVALHCRGEAAARGAPARPAVGDGVMQLFVAVLQRLVDDASEQSVLRRVTRLDAATRALLSRHARAALHLFVLTRAMARGRRGELGFRNAGEVRAWLSGDAGVWALADTPAGSAPGWLLRTPAEQRAADPAFASFPPDADEDGTEDSAQLRETVRTAETLRHIRESPLGVYLQHSNAAAAAATKGSGLATGGFKEEMKLLTRLADEGSAVAGRMLHARMLWVMGEDAMREDGGGREAEAVECFADSLRAARADGDPFSGWIIVRAGDDQASALARYAACADAVLRTEPEQRDATLLRAWALVRSGRLSEADVVLTAAVARDDACDVHGALAERANLRGNMARWQDALTDSARCAQLCPEEPMYHYWEGTARRQLMDKESDATGAAADAARACFRRFLAAASPEGRKVCEALYALVLLELPGLAAAKGKLDPACPEVARVADLVRQAQAAEAARLPVFAPVDSQLKPMAINILRLIEAPRNAEGLIAAPALDVLLNLPSAGPARATALRAEGNKAFGAKHFEDADEHYTAALKAAPGDAELLANRAAARLALRRYTAAAQDAAAAAAARPDWAKPHYRAAQAHIGRRDGAAAVIAAHAAAALAPEDSNVARVLAEAEAEAQRVVTPLPEPRSDAELWARVAYKDNVATVSPTGGAAFACVADALQQLLRPGAAGATLVLHPGLYDEQPLVFANGEHLQLLGSLTGGTEQPRAELQCGSETIVTAGGAATEVALERLQLTYSATSGIGHCVCVTTGATVRVADCVARTPDAPAFAVDGQGSRLSLARVAVRRSGAAVIADNGGAAECDDCTFAACGHPAAESRGGGAVVLRGCTFTKCSAQAALIHRGGARLELHDCTMRGCGKRPQMAVVLAGCGTLLLRRCLVEDNATDAIVLQSDPTAPTELATVLLDSCSFARNDVAIHVYSGSGLMSRCTVRDNAMLGASVHSVAPHKQFTVRGCTFERNGSAGARCDISVSGHTLMERCVRIDADNTLSTPPMILQDSAVAHIREQVQAEVAEMGLNPTGGPGPAPEGATSPVVGWQRSREELIRHHLEAVKRQTKLSAEGMCLTGANDSSNPEGRKAASRPPPPLASLTPVAVRELRPGKTHNGRVLRGTLLVPPLAQAGLLTLLRDDAGDVTKLALYGALPPVAYGELLGARARAAARLLPEGARVGVAEPFFKLMADGTYGVRVDNPQELTVVLPRQDAKTKRRG